MREVNTRPTNTIFAKKVQGDDESEEVVETNDSSPAAGESSKDRKERKRKEAQARQELSRKKGPLEKKISELETGISELEKVEEELISKFNEELSGEEFKEVNQKLVDAADQKEKMEFEWEQLNMELEELLEEFKGVSS